MTLLSPLALLWLASIPVLVWLWRFAASRHRVRVPSLVPFEHLLRRPPTRRTHLVVNALFWLQLAALILIALALAEPALIGHRTRTVLVLLDTSASMSATIGGKPSPFQQATRELLARIARRRPAEQFVLAMSAPVQVLNAEPSREASQLRQLVRGVFVSELAGNLATAHRIARALLQTPPDETWVLTDEPVPDPVPEASVVFRSFGTPLPNVAIVGLDTSESLCTRGAAKLLVIAQNFADVKQPVTMRLQDGDRVVATHTLVIEPRGRAPFAFSVPEDAVGVRSVSLEAEQDALAVDNQVLVSMRGAQPISVVVASNESRFAQTVGQWLDACQGISWSAASLPTKTSAATGVLITDQAELAEQWPAGVMAFSQGVTQQHLPAATPVELLGAAQAGMTLAHWLVDSAHPIGAYLAPIETVASATEWSGVPRLPGEPVLWGLANGRRVPLVLATERAGRRRVDIRLDPTASASSVPMVLVFLNSLQWLSSPPAMTTTGEPLVVGPFVQGLARLQRPHQAEELRPHAGGWLRLDDTDRAGLYRFTQGSHKVERVVNFLDPVESNTMRRSSTWEWLPTSRAASRPTATPTQPLANALLRIVLVCLLVEWLLYARKRPPTPPGLRAREGHPRW